MLNVRIEEQTYNELKALAEKQGRSLSNLVQLILDKTVKGEIKP
ncbi:ribbon-helix-helix domain-containing protein [Imperialibacter roseus]|jgi:predicted HicB family RNase H-like nuclease